MPDDKTKKGKIRLKLVDKSNAKNLKQSKKTLVDGHPKRQGWIGKLDKKWEKNLIKKERAAKKKSSARTKEFLDGVRKSLDNVKNQQDKQDKESRIKEKKKQWKKRRYRLKKNAKIRRPYNRPGGIGGSGMFSGSHKIRKR